MRYAALVALLAAFVLQVWFIYWKNAHEPQVSSLPKDPWLATDVGTPHLYAVGGANRARTSTNNPNLGDCVIQGTVLSPAGEPVSGVEVQAEKRSLAPEDSFRTGRRGERWNGVTDEAGKFSFSTLPPGEFVVAARTSESVTLAPAVLSEHGSQELTLKLQEAGPLPGTVQTPSGQPVQNATVYPVRISGQHEDPLFRLYPAKTDAAGAFSFPELPRAAWDLLVITREHTPTLVRQVQHDLTPVKLSLQAGASLEGRLLTAEEGKAVGGLPIILVEKELGLERVTTRTNPAGVFRAENLRAGEYVVSLNNTRWAMQEAAPTANTGASADSFIVVVEKTGSVRGRVVSESDEAWGIPEAVVRATPQSGGEAMEVKTDARGGYFFPGLKAGDYVLNIASAGVLAPAQGGGETVNIVSGKRTEGPVFRAKAGAEIAGVVLDAAGQEVAGATVHLQQAEEEATKTARTDSFGKFVFTGLRHEQEVVLWAEKQGMQSLAEGPGTALNFGGKTLELQLSLPNTGGVSGRVVNAQGSGITGVPVVCTPAGGAKLQELRASTGAHGQFAFKALPPAEYYLHVAQSGPYANIQVPVILQEGTQAEGVEIVLP